MWAVTVTTVDTVVVHFVRKGDINGPLCVRIQLKPYGTTSKSLQLILKEISNENLAQFLSSLC